jgi:hypothetical protein
MYVGKYTKFVVVSTKIFVDGRPDHHKGDEGEEGSFFVPFVVILRLSFGSP